MTNLFYNFSVIKIELNQSILPHHTSLDAVLLAGYQPKSTFQESMFQRGIINLQRDVCNKHHAKKSDSSSRSIVEDNQWNVFSRLPVSIHKVIRFFSIFFCIRLLVTNLFLVRSVLQLRVLVCVYIVL